MSFALRLSSDCSFSRLSNNFFRYGLCWVSKTAIFLASDAVILFAPFFFCALKWMSLLHMTHLCTSQTAVAVGLLISRTSTLDSDLRGFGFLYWQNEVDVDHAV